MSDNLFSLLARDADSDDELIQGWFALVGGFTLIERELRQALNEQNSMSLPRFDTLTALMHSKKGLTMGELADRLVVTKGNVTGVVRRLEEDGLVRKTSPSADRRVQHVVISAEGRRTWRKVFNTYQRVVGEAFGVLSAKELQLLTRALLKLSTAEHS